MEADGGRAFDDNGKRKLSPRMSKDAWTRFRDSEQGRRSRERQAEEPAGASRRRPQGADVTLRESQEGRQGPQALAEAKPPEPAYPSAARAEPAKAPTLPSPQPRPGNLQLFTMEEAAGQLRVSRRWLQDFVQEHPYYRLAGHRKLFTQVDINRLFAAFPEPEQPRPLRLSRVAQRSTARGARSDKDTWNELQALLAKKTPRRRTAE